MPTWKEQLQQIQTLRIQRQLADDSLYASRINLLKSQVVLEKIKRKETFIPTNLSGIKALQSQIADNDGKLLSLNKQLGDAANLDTKIKQGTALAASLASKAKVLEGSVDQLNRQIALEKQNKVPNKIKLAGFQKQQLLIASQEKSLQVDQGITAKSQQVLLGQKKQIDALKTGWLVQQKQLQDAKLKLQQDLDNQVKINQPTLGETQKKIVQYTAEKTKAISGLTNAITGLHEAVSGIYTDNHPRSTIGNLDDGIPFLLFPVRIETRFMGTAASPEIWIRIYPDDIAVHTHEKTLTDKEIDAGENYWTSVFTAVKSGDADDDLKKNAWNMIVSVFGSNRSAWIAGQTKPTNWSADLSGIADPSKLIFPVQSIAKPDAWSRAPRTNVMPDKFVVMLYTGGAMVKEEVGNTIPDELFLGPDPLDTGSGFQTSPIDNTLVFGDAFNWMSDFDKAVQSGMGFKIPISSAQQAAGFDKILVLGALLSSDENTSSQMLEDLIDNHHYSPDGFSLIKQGTPTNNTEMDGSGYTKSDSFTGAGYYTEAGDPLFSATDDCDGRDLANALGISYDPLQFIANSNGTDHKEAVAMNTALYSSTLGYYFETMLQPVMDEPSQDQLRNFFTTHISGRGPLPAIRVGDQPYGVLLTSDFSKWKWAAGEPTWSVPFLNNLYKVLNYYQSLWTGLLGQLMYTGKPESDPSDVLLNILGLQAGSVSFFQRVAYSTDDLNNQAEFMNGGDYFNDLSNTLVNSTGLMDFLKSMGYDHANPDGTFTTPQLLLLVYQHFHTALNPANLIDGMPLSETNPMLNYDDTLKKNYLNWLAETASITALQQQNFGAGKTAPTALLFLQLRRSLLLELVRASVKWFQKNNLDASVVLKPANFFNIRPAPDLTKWEVIQGKIGTVLPAHPQKEMAVGEWLLSSGSTETEAAFLNQVRSSLQLLSGLPTARLERCFTEHLDTCTYRLDAWQTGLFKQRLDKQRQPLTTTTAKKGVFIGAYGWVENIRPATKTVVPLAGLSQNLQPPPGKGVYEFADNGGFVHAPSINHAAAAAVLRNGYLSHASSANPDLMAVNLSSERVRRAMFILDGIRNGQQLEALLGYQFETGLHDRAKANTSLVNLNLYIYNFRDQFPISQNKILQDSPSDTTETIPANNVVNGLMLSEITTGFPYGAKGEVVSATTVEQQAIVAEWNKLADSLDAIKDLLLSESVFQAVQGNFDRSGAVMNALRDAQIPPVIEVVDTPRSSLLSFTNRVTLQFAQVGAGEEGYNPWPLVPITARAMMEPGLNKWLGKILGDPTEIACMVSHSGADAIVEIEEVSIDLLDLQPIDLVYISGDELNTGSGTGTGASELESRISFYYRRLKNLDENVLLNIQFLEPSSDQGKKPLGNLLPLLRSLKSLVTNSRTIHAEDFDPPSSPGLVDATNPKGYQYDELLGRVTAAQTALHSELSSMNSLSITEPDSTISNLGDVFIKLDAAGSNFTPAYTFTNSSSLQTALTGISNFGVPDSFPVDNDILEQARNIARIAGTTLQAASDLIAKNSAANLSTDQKISNLIDAAKVIFGNAFTVIPLFSYNNATDVQQSYNDGDQLVKYAKDSLKMNFVAAEWMQQTAHVRPALAKWDYIHTLFEIFNGGSLDLFPIQLPYHSGDNWLAVEFPPLNPDNTPFNINNDTLSVVIHGDPACFGAGAQGGLMIDDWTESIPASQEMTGVSFNYNQPNAMPAQALLLAVTPEEKGAWNWDNLVGMLNDTLLRAKLRAVEPSLLETVNSPELNTLLPAVLSGFSQYDIDLSLDFRMSIPDFAAKNPITAIAAS